MQATIKKTVYDTEKDELIYMAHHPETYTNSKGITFPSNELKEGLYRTNKGRFYIVTYYRTGQAVIEPITPKRAQFKYKMARNFSIYFDKLWIATKTFEDVFNNRYPGPAAWSDN